MIDRLLNRLNMDPEEFWGEGVMFSPSSRTGEKGAHLQTKVTNLPCEPPSRKTAGRRNGAEPPVLLAACGDRLLFLPGLPAGSARTSRMRPNRSWVTYMSVRDLTWKP